MNKLFTVVLGILLSFSTLFCNAEDEYYSIISQVATDYVTTSPDGNIKVSVILKSDGKKAYVIDGKEEKTYLELFPVFFSPDNKNYLYAAKVEEGKEAYVYNGTEQKTYNNTIAPPVFSPDSKTYIYQGQRDDGLYVSVINGVEQEKGYIYIDYETFSPDSKNYAYLAKVEDGKFVVVVNGIEGKEHDGVTSPAFSADSKEYAYGINDNGRRVMTINGKENFIENDFRLISPMYYFESGDKLYIGLNRNGTTTIILNGNPTGDSEEQEGFAIMTANSLLATKNGAKYKEQIDLIVKALSNEKLANVYGIYGKLDLNSIKLKDGYMEFLVYLGNRVGKELYDRYSEIFEEFEE